MLIKSLQMLNQNKNEKLSTWIYNFLTLPHTNLTFKLLLRYAVWDNNVPFTFLHTNLTFLLVWYLSPATNKLTGMSYEQTLTTLSVPHVAKRLSDPQPGCTSTLYNGSRLCHEISGVIYFIVRALLQLIVCKANQIHLYQHRSLSVTYNSTLPNILKLMAPESCKNCIN